MRRAWIIAGREVAAYTGTLSFWLALIVAPVLMGLVALVGPSPGGPPARTLAIAAPTPDLDRAARGALQEAARLDGVPIRLVPQGSAADTVVTLVRDPSGAVRATTAGLPLSPVATALLSRDLATRPRTPAAVVQPEVPPAPEAGPPKAGRFAVAMLLWVNLVGALGMLLQAIVRERANKALDILLASARPLEVVLGKLAGVGAVSAIVLTAWLGSAAALAGLAGDQGGGALLKVLFGALSSPAALAHLGLLYLLAYLLYGAVLLGLGAAARDLPSAQNMSRPMFALMVVVFFAMLAELQGAGLSWLVWAPPFTPFLLMASDPATLSGAQRLGATLILAVSAFAALTIVAAAFTPRRSRAKGNDAKS